MKNLHPTRFSLLLALTFLGAASLAVACDDGSSTPADLDSVTGGTPGVGGWPAVTGGNGGDLPGPVPVTGGAPPLLTGGTGGVSGSGGSVPGSGGAQPSGCDANVSLAQAAASSGRLVGAALAAHHLTSDTQYATVAAREFNYVTPENEMKWSYVEPSPNSWDFAAADQIVAFASKHNMKVKGHTLVWHSQLPKWMEELTGAEAVRAALERHVRTVAGHYKGKVYAWDVVNEAFSDDSKPVLRNSVFQKHLGEEFIAQSFRWAHEADPDALLFYNDYSIEYPGAKLDAVYSLVSRLKAAGVPIHGVGFQSHVNAADAPTNAQFAGVIKRFTDLGLLVNISEIDVSIGSKVSGDLPTRVTLQRNTYRSLVAACVANPKCHSVTVWGVPDKYSWLNMPEFWTWAGQGPHYPLLFDDSYGKKPAYDGVLDAFCGR